MMMQKGTPRNSCLVPYTLQPFKAITSEGKPFEGIPFQVLPNETQSRSPKTGLDNIDLQPGAV